MSDPLDPVRAILGAPKDVDLPEGLAAEAGALPGDDPSDPGPMPDGDPGPQPEDRAPQASEGPGEAPEAEGSRLPLNDTGNGRRFALYFGGDAMWVPRVGWHVWTGQRWQVDPDQIEVRKLGQKIGEKLIAEAALLALGRDDMELLRSEGDLRARAAMGDDPDAVVALAQIESKKRLLGALRKSHRDFARSSGNSGKIDALLKEGGVFLAHPFETLDAPPLEVNCESGVLRFSVTRAEGMSAVAGVELVPHAREQLLTKMMPVAWDPAATCPRFDAFLARVQPREDIRGFLQRWMGLSMTALTVQKLVFNHGAGANGKSVLVDLMARLLGDYSATAKIESLTGRNRRSGGDATPDLVPLMGARMVRASEPEEGERLQEGKIKELTGGEPILVRALNEDFVEVHPVFKLTMSGNHKPDIRGTDDGIWRRMLLVPWDVQIPEAERDPTLIDKLFEERSGILNWMVQGLLDFLEGGLREPAAVLEATRTYREESDPIGTFLTECTVVSGDDADFVRPRDLVDACRYWQEQMRGETPFGDRTISNRLRDKAGRWRHPGSGRCFTVHKSGDRSYRGIRLTDLFQAEFDKRPRRSGEGAARGGGSGGGDDLAF